MTSYLFISNTENFKFDNSFFTKINNILAETRLQKFDFYEVKKNEFYEWQFKKNKLCDCLKLKIKKILSHIQLI